MTTETQIRRIAREELSNYDFSRRVESVLFNTNQILKQDLIQLFDAKIEAQIARKAESQRNDIFRTFREFARNDPVIMRNIEKVTEEFRLQSLKHSNNELERSKQVISSFLTSEVNRISGIPPYEQIAAQLKKDMQTMETKNNVVIGSLAAINVGLLTYLIFKK